MGKPSFHNKYDAWLDDIDQKALSAWVSLKSAPTELPDHFLERSHLNRALSDGKPITWLMAPAGYGKSTAMSHWYSKQLEQSGNVGIWLTLDQKDNLASFLLRHLLEAANKVVPGVATDALARWSATVHEGSVDTEEVLLLLLDELTDLNCPLILCIDNVHELKNPDAWRVVASLMENLPEEMRLMLASRHIPVALGKMRLNTRLGFLNQHDLAFPLPDTLAWLQKNGIDEPQQQAMVLTQRMHGWPAGLGLWLACVRSHHTPVVVLPDNDQMGQEELADYLMGEVLQSLSEELKQFLICVSPMQGFSPDLCDYVLKQDNSTTLIHELASRNLFIDSMDERSGWFCLHPLFADLLLRFSTEQERRDIHRRAFQWLRDRDYRIEALRHARAGGLGAEVSPWIEEEADQLLADHDTASLLAWFDLVGDDLIEGSLRLRLIYTWILLLTCQYEAAEAQIAGLQKCSIDQEFPGQMSALTGYLAQSVGNYPLASELCELALRELPDSRFSSRVLMCSVLANIELMKGNADGARVWNRLELDISRQNEATCQEALAMFNYARIEQHRGHLQRAAEVVEQGNALTRQLTGNSQALANGRLTLFRAFIDWLQADPEQAEINACAGVHEAIRCRDVYVLYGYSLLSLIHTGKEHFSAALAALSQAERLMQRWNVSESVYQSWLSTVKANVWMSQKKWQRAADSLKMAHPEGGDKLPGSELFPMLEDFWHASMARLRLLQGNTGEALEYAGVVLERKGQGIMQIFASVLEKSSTGEEEWA